MNKLEEIIHHKRLEVEVKKIETPLSFITSRTLYSKKILSLIDCIRTAENGFGIIAEFKRRSPSAGTINETVDPAEAALKYARTGAAAVSVLTDEKYFGGTLDDLERVRTAVTIPVLRKDFIIDEYQLHEAKAYGADAVLLIADVLPKDELEHLFDRAFELGLECLVEIYDSSHIEKLDFEKMKLIGINNRDLRTFEVDLHHTRDIIQKLPDDILVISESGIQSNDDIKLVQSFGAQGVLIGEWYMKNIRPFIKICGITNIEDALVAAELETDAVGFIFYEQSPRYINPKQAAAIIQHLPESIHPVGVFVNHPRNVIEDIINETGIRIVQLHGDELPHECRYDSVHVWKAIRPMNGDEIGITNGYNVDAFLFDTFEKNKYGGTGATGNWKLAQATAQKYRVILSGGLNPDNITEAVSIVKPFGVDINSGVESEPGKKDKQKLEELFTILTSHKKRGKEVLHVSSNEIHRNRRTNRSGE